MTTATLIGRASRTADQVRIEADKIDPIHALRLLLIIPFLVIGWLAGMVVRVSWALISLACGAVKVGFLMALGKDIPEPL